MLSVIQFLHPVFLYGLLLLVIPVLLHLFSLKRYKKVYFSNFNFLEALQKQKKNSSRLKNLVLLFLRLLALSCIVIAFATPYLNPEGKALPATTTPRIFIYADNSFSMTNTGSQGSLFEEAKKHLFDIVDTRVLIHLELPLAVSACSPMIKFFRSHWIKKKCSRLSGILKSARPLNHFLKSIKK